MKVIPSNQTLILANERGMSRNSVPTLASQPDDMLVYLRANYGNPSSAYQSSRGIALYANTQRAGDTPVGQIDVFA